MKLDGPSLFMARQTSSSSSNFCGWENGVITVVDNTLYIGSGMYRTPSETDIRDTKNAHPSVNGKNQFISQSLSSKTPLLSETFHPISKPSDIPTLRNGAIWSSSNKVFEFGGLIVNPATQEAVTKDQTYSIYNIASEKWSKKPLPEEVRRFSGGSAQGNGKGFYYKGKVTSESTVGVAQEKFPTDMLIFDMETEAFRTVPGDPDSTKEVTYNTVAYAPFGKNGTVISMGGLGFAGLLSYDVASVYDIATDTWYRVSLSGARPQKRIGACSASMSAPDRSSHQIFLYGGFDPKVHGGYDDIYVLSLPAFSWQKVWTGDKVARSGMACTAVGRSMIVLGGTMVTNRSNCEDRMERTVFDLTKLEWDEEGKVDPDAKYLVADQIVKNIGGTPEGGATRQEPVGGWARDGLREVFGIKSETTLAPEESNGKGGEDNKGAIIGGVVGGVVGALLIAFSLYCLLRRRCSKAAVSEFSELSGDGPGLAESFKPTSSQTGSNVDDAEPTVAVLELEDRRTISELGGAVSELGVTERSVNSEDSASATGGGFRSELPGSMPSTYRALGSQAEHPKVWAERQRNELEQRETPRYS